RAMKREDDRVEIPFSCRLLQAVLKLQKDGMVDGPSGQSPEGRRKADLETVFLRSVENAPCDRVGASVFHQGVWAKRYIEIGALRDDRVEAVGFVIDGATQYLSFH